MVNLNKHKITVRCEAPEFLDRYYRIVGGLFPGNLSDKDREIIAAFYVNGGAITATSRAKVADMLRTTVLNINNYLDRLRKKNAVIVTDGENKFHPVLLPVSEAAQDIPLNFIFKINGRQESGEA